MSDYIISRRKIIKWARQVDRDWDRDMNPVEWLEHFAADVQAEVARKEREACAKVIDEIAQRREYKDWWVLRDAAFAIRNRGKA